MAAGDGMTTGGTAVIFALDGAAAASVATWLTDEAGGGTAAAVTGNADTFSGARVGTSAVASIPRTLPSAFLKAAAV